MEPSASVPFFCLACIPTLVREFKWEYEKSLFIRVRSFKRTDHVSLCSDLVIWQEFQRLEIDGARGFVYLSFTGMEVRAREVVFFTPS
jgi:hypothetical protein